MTQPQNIAERIMPDLGPRCAGCNRMLAVQLSRPWVIDCPRCGIRNSGA